MASVTTFVKCSSCGSDLECTIEVSTTSNNVVISISPCDKCMESQYQIGFEEGQYEAAHRGED